MCIKKSSKFVVKKKEQVDLIFIFNGVITTPLNLRDVIYDGTEKDQRRTQNCCIFERSWIDCCNG